MRSHEERIAEVRRRITEKERQKRRKQRRIVAISCIAACLAVIFGASFVMSGISGQMVPGNSSGYETAATILGGGAVLNRRQKYIFHSAIENITKRKSW